MKVTFTEKEFATLRNFQNAFNKKLGSEAYVGTDSATLLVEYSPRLKAMLRPFPQTLQFEFELLNLTCVGCKKQQPFLCEPGETEYRCSDCISKQSKKNG